MKIDFDSVAGRELREDEEPIEKKDKPWKYRHIEKKYNHPGVYCIKINNKVLYVGKSIDMKSRVFTHRQEIRQGTEEKKYQILSEALKRGERIDFDVLYTSTLEDIEEAKADIKEREDYYINYYLPPLNKQIPKHKDFDKQVSLLPQVNNYQDALALAIEQ